jgi:hypothetical protein
VLVGIDLDNTIISYDELFVGLAREMGLVSPGFRGSKTAVREAIRAGESGDVGWQKLQALAYGPRITRAKLADGIKTLLSRASDRKVPVVVVSHKTQFSPYGDGADLRAAALAWMAANGLFNDEKGGLRPENVFFESTRQDKIRRIESLGCTHFVDDLYEVFNEPEFPAGIRPYLYAAGYEEIPQGRFRAFRNHNQIADHLFGVDPLVAATALCSGEIEGIEPVVNGRNNRLYRVATSTGVFALKSYPAPDDDPQDRLGAEYGALEFLKRQNEASVPAPLAIDRTLGAALYEWVEGSPIVEASTEGINQVIEFTRRMHEYRQHEMAAGLPLASEACLSAGELLRQIQRRDRRLSEVAVANAELAGLLDRLRGFRDSIAAALPGDLNKDVPARFRTLNPSDFGFHNSIRRPDGQIVFLDFEYFGWDDPVKLAADLMLHPAMQLNEGQSAYLARGMVDIFGADPDFQARLARLLPLYAVRWCLIMLNEFLPERWARRAIAGEVDQSEAKTKQLAKAEAMLKAAVALTEDLR